MQVSDEDIAQVIIYPLDQQFQNFSKFNDLKSDGKYISIQQIDRWFCQAQVVDDRYVTLTDTGVCFNKFKVRLLDYKSFVQFLQDFCDRKNLDLKEVKEKLKSCGLPEQEKQQPVRALVHSYFLYLYFSKLLGYL